MMQTNPFLISYDHLLSYGKEYSPRGKKVLEIENYSMTFHPIDDRFSNFGPRKMNIDYAKKEFAWYLRGQRFETSIADEAQMWKDIIDIDGGINSNYGQYIYHDQAQIWWVISVLEKDQDSRQAVMSLLNYTHLRDDNPDVVCTYAIGFRIRDNKLNMSVHMRSWDAIWGMTNDVFCFSCIYETVYMALRAKYPDLLIGNYHHTADSFHVYERHWPMLEELVELCDDDLIPVYCPRIISGDEVFWLMNHLNETIDCTIKEHKFSRWLFNLENDDET